MSGIGWLWRCARAATASAALLFLGFANPSAAAPDAPLFPQVAADNLLGQSADFPRDLPGDPTLVLVAFERGDQSDIDAWIEALDLKDTARIPWIEMPVVGGSTRVIKPLLDGWMRDGIPSAEAQARVFTLYSSRKRFKRALSVPKTPGILAVVARRDGSVVSLFEGPPTQDMIDATLALFPTPDNNTAE